MYKVRVKIPVPHTKGGESRSMTETERTIFIAKLAPSKYAPHQGKAEKARRLK